MPIKTADLYDQHEASLQIAEPLFRNFGGNKAFHGSIVTLKVFEDNTLVRDALGEAGAGNILVVDGGGSLRCALLGDNLAAMGAKNQWAGIVIYGCIRDAVDISSIDIGVKALNTNPRKSVKRGEGQRDLALQFAGVNFIPGHYLYADEDGIVIAEHKLDD